MVTRIKTTVAGHAVVINLIQTVRLKLADWDVLGNVTRNFLLIIQLLLMRVLMMRIVLLDFE